LREALKLLAGTRLIRATKGPGGGIFVAHTADEGMRQSLSDNIAMMLDTGSVTLEELLEARALLEVPLAGRAAYQAGDDTLTRLREALAAESAALPDGLEELAAADAEFHRAIAAASDNRMVEAITGWMFEVLQPALLEALQDAIVHSAVVDQHEAILAAIEKGDAARAERGMKDHLLYLGDVLRMVHGDDAALDGPGTVAADA
jgi:GntR family transcriptional regulator, transcriptional repressor for pyruvate dehydrogenase complex